MSIARLFVAFLIIVINSISLNAFAQSSKAADPSVLSAVIEGARKSATSAQHACMRYVQMNVFEFEECINDRLHVKGTSLVERLGITYMGLVGALSGQRMGSQGSNVMAWEFAKKTQKIQQKMGLKDVDLCGIISGDCESRVARTRLILNGPRPTALTEAEMAGAHRH